MLETKFISEANTKRIKVKYLMVDILSPYNSIIERTILNILGMIIPTLHLNLKYSLPDERVGSVRGKGTMRPPKNSIRATLE